MKNSVLQKNERMKDPSSQPYSPFSHSSSEKKKKKNLRTTIKELFPPSIFALLS